MYCCHISHTLVKTTPRILAQQIRRPKKGRRKKPSSYHDVDGAIPSPSERTTAPPATGPDERHRGLGKTAAAPAPIPSAHSGCANIEWRTFAPPQSPACSNLSTEGYRHPRPPTLPARLTGQRRPGWIDETIRYASMSFGHHFKGPNVTGFSPAAVQLIAPKLVVLHGKKS